MRPLFVIAVLCFGCFETHADSPVVASVGTYTITADDLLTSYEFGPAFVKRGKDPLRRHLNYMVYERLLALAAVHNGLNASEFVQERVQALEEDGAVEQLYRDDILSQIRISESQIRQDVQKAKISVSFRWIFKQKKSEAEQVLTAMADGTSFDSLFMRQLDPAVPAESRSLETTLLKLERDNRDFAESLTKLSVGECSQPIRGNDGFYIVRLDKAWQNPLTTESEYAVLKNQAVEIRTKIVSDGLADAYVKNMMKSYNPVIKAEGFNILRAYIASQGLSRDTKVKWEIPSTFMTEAGPQPIGNSGDHLKKILVSFGNNSMTVRDYVRWYDIRQFQFDTRSLAAFNSSVKKTIWKMVQDKLLSEEAYRRELNRTPSVAHESKKWESKILYLAQRSALLRSISLSDSVLRSYYSGHSKKYAVRGTKIPAYMEIKDVISIDYYNAQESLLLLRTLEGLKMKYPVAIDEEDLVRLSKNVQPDSRAIETVFYKPGGTFPRVAFPTIDEAWSRME